MLFQWFRQFFAGTYVAPGDGPRCPRCDEATELIDIGAHRGKCFCKTCIRHYIIKKS